MNGQEKCSNTYYYYMFAYLFLRQASLYKSGCPGMYLVDQADLKFTKVHLLLPPNAEIKGMYH